MIFLFLISYLIWTALMIILSAVFINLSLLTLNYSFKNILFISVQSLSLIVITVLKAFFKVIRRVIYL